MSATCYIMGKLSDHMDKTIIFSTDKIFFSYPSPLIENEFRKFFLEYISSSSSFLPFSDNEKQCFNHRNKLLGQPTLRQSQSAMNAATANIDNEQTEDEEQQQDPSKSVIKTEQKQKPYEEKLIIHYTHEKILHDFKRDIHRVYDDVFKNTPVSDVKLIVGNRNRRNASKELIHKRPKLSILQNKLKKSKF